MTAVIRLGDKVTDRVTGLIGIAVARIQYLNGCVQFCVQPRTAEDAMKIDSHYIDEGQLKRIGDGINEPPKIIKLKRKLMKNPPRLLGRSGGSMANAPRTGASPGPKP